ncbi:small ribosomal subunit protein mS39-like [Physella acuta]|uniref:small ribosomal subunit protein mS39-like n=1 Tax=Physella acuta TaxID=109671 RepID=UPI0027DC0BC3|nr:small ribosomal subunit protein mS39-like [Physella acuta]
MAAALRQNTKVTLKVTRIFVSELTHRYVSTSRACLGNTLKIYQKPKRNKDFVPAPTPIVLDPSAKDDEPIIIPDRIDRSPTAILEALAATVRNDVNQPMHASIDDPYLYATSDRVKKNFIAAKGSGQKTARMMISMYPDYFTKIWPEPMPEAWEDLFKEYIHKDASEEALLERMKRKNITDAIQVYKKAKAEKIQLSQEVQEKFLELLTVYNCSNPNNEDDCSLFIEALQVPKHSPFPQCTWEKGNIAEQVFNSLPEKTATAYNNIIRGMAANFDKKSAMAMYNEMKSANFQADVYTYNLLLAVISLDNDSFDVITQEIEGLLKEMAALNIRPNVETFNSILFNCRRVSKWSGAKKFALSVFAEMKACGVEPSLGTYTDLLNIFYYSKERVAKDPTLFLEILDDIEGKEFQCTSQNDGLFFRNAMRVISTFFPESTLALRVHKIATTGKNSDLIGHRQLQYGYYNDLFHLVIQLEHIDETMKLYQSVVPFIYVPNVETYLSILESLVMYDSYHYLPVLYAELSMSNMFKDETLISAFTNAMSKQKLEPKLQGELCDIARSMLKNWEQKVGSMSHDKLAISGSVLGDFIVVFLNNNDLVTAWELFKLYQDRKDMKVTNPSANNLKQLCENLIQAKSVDQTKEVLNLMLSLDYEEVSPLVEQALQTLDLTEQERYHFEGLAGSSSSSSSSSSDSD